MAVRFARVLGAILVAGVLGACSLMSKNPAGPLEAAISEPQLFGNWVHTDEGELFILHIFPFASGDGTRLNVLFVGGSPEEGGWYALTGHVSEVAPGRRYLNLAVVTSTPDLNANLDDAFPDRGEYPYGFMPYRIVDADHLELGAPPMDEALAAVREGRLAGTVVEGSFPLTKLSDTSENIAAFLASLDEAKIFAQPMKFTRLAPPTP